MNSIQQYEITFQNIVDIIDEAILQLKNLKSGGNFPHHLKEKIVNIMGFLKKAKTDDYEDLLLDKGVYMEKEPLLRFHNNLKIVEIDDAKIDTIIKFMNSMEDVSISRINNLQHLLLELSIPIWNVKLNN